jgi:PAS domain S-box-containing protein
MRKIRTAIIGAGREGSSLYYCFKMKPNVDIVAIADVTGQGLGVEEAAKNGVFISTSLEDILSIKFLDVIVETTKDPEIAAIIHKLKSPNTQVVEASSLDLMVVLGDKKEIAEAELNHVIGSINDAVIVVDKEGIPTYVNKQFEKLTGMDNHEIKNQRIYERFDGNPIFKVLSSGQSISGQKFTFGNHGKELNYDISPIRVRQEVVGAVGVFRSSPDIVKLMEELQRSSSIIEGLYDKLNRVNGLAELNVSDVMSIDKMEQILLRQALTKYGYSVEGKKRAAKTLNISLATLYNKLKKYQIN